MSPAYATCADCDAEDRQGNCAPKRCYCGHETCWAYETWVPRSQLTAIATPQNTERMARTWAEREEPTWLDR